MKRRIAALVAACMLTLSTAMADVSFLPGWAALEDGMTSSPVAVTFSAQLNALVPLDENRVASLNKLLSHLSLEATVLQAGQENWGRVRALVDNAEALSMTQRTLGGFDQLSLSSLPNTTFTVGRNDESALSAPITADAASLLFGGGFDLPFLDGDAANMLKAARALLPRLKIFFFDHMESAASTKKISKMGTSATRNTFAWTADEPLNLGATLAAQTDSLPLKTLLTSLVFTGKQKFVTYEDVSGRVLSLSYSGNCGVDAEHQRKVSLEWTLKDDGSEARDDFTLKSPAVSGSDRNTLTIDRVESFADDTGKLSLDVKYDTRLDKAVNTVTVSVDLKNALSDGTPMLTGSATLKTTDSDANTITWTITPSLTLSTGDAPLTASGTASVSRKDGKRVMLDAVLTLSLAQGASFNWLLAGNIAALDTADADTLAALQVQAESAVAADLTRKLMTIPRDDLSFLLDGLTDDAVQRIIDAWNP